MGEGLRVGRFSDVAGYAFRGPFAERDELPHGPALFLVAHRRGAGWYLLGVDHADDVAAALRTHPRLPCWDEAADGATLYAFVHPTAEPPAWRAEMVGRIRLRYPRLPCG